MFKSSHINNTHLNIGRQALHVLGGGARLRRHQLDEPVLALGHVLEVLVHHATTGLDLLAQVLLEVGRRRGGGLRCGGGRAVDARRLPLAGYRAGEQKVPLGEQGGRGDDGTEQLVDGARAVAAAQILVLEGELWTVRTGTCGGRDEVG